MRSSKLSLWFRLVCIAACCLALIPCVAARAEVPTPISVLGHNPGDDFYLADYEDTVRYFHALAAASDRIKMFTVGKTTEGKDIEIAVISSPQNLAKLDEYQEDCRPARPRDQSERRAGKGTGAHVQGDCAHRRRPARR